MAFANGIFARLYSWVSDRDGGIKIRADRMDAEFDGIKDALNEITAGTVQHIGGMKGYDGTVSAPGYTFFSDTNTGMYRIGADNIGWAIGGAVELDLNGTRLAPGASDGSALGSTTLMWSDLFLASGAVINWNNGDVTATHSANALAFAGASSGYTFDAAVTASANDGAALGASGTAWADLFLADGGVLNFNAGNATLTHSSDALTIAISGTDKVLFGSTGMAPTTNDAYVLGTATKGWSDLFLAEGAVINWDNGDVTITQTGNVLAFAGAATSYTFDALIDLSGAAAGQVKFPATQNASANANTLDDYEEGTATVTAAFATVGTSSWAYTTQSLSYTKIGDIASSMINFNGTPTIGTGSGNCTFSGHPFSSISGGAAVAVRALNNQFTWAAGTTQVVGSMLSGVSSIALTMMGSASNGATIGASHMTSGGAHTFVANIQTKVT